MKKRLIALIVILLVLIILGTNVYINYNGNNKKEQNITTDNKNNENSCLIDEDCVPASCCHANSCVAKNNAPSCIGIYCTQECSPDTLDCGQGRCACINNKCSAQIIGK